MAQQSSTINTSITTETESFDPKQIFHIVTHSGLTKTIKVLDITDQVSEAYDSDEFTKQVEEIPKSNPPEPCLTVTRGHWWNNRFTVESPSETGTLAEWKGGLTSWSTH